MNKKIEVIYEDDNFLIVNKPSGMLVHKTQHNEEENLIDLINKRIESNKLPTNNEKNYYLIHRIDKFTSGVVLIAKNKKTLTLMQKMFSKNQVEKTYFAIVTKTLPAKKIKITLSLGRSKTNKLMFSNKNAKNYKPTCTEARIIDRNFIEVFLKTGRTHQIRAHLHEIGCSILNDPVYGGCCKDSKLSEGENFGQYLHAYKILFRCPVTNTNIEAKAKLPDKFLCKLKELNISEEAWTKI